MSDVVIRTEKLSKTFVSGFFRKKVRALEDLMLEVRRGEVFGFLGPNGAGKTTTLKLLVGLCFPTAGRAWVLGQPVPDATSRMRLGFLPETPYFYDYLSGEEFLELCGRLFGLSAEDRRARAKRLLEMVGLGDAARRPLRKYSKGMLQRIGLAQALINDPELVILDEPMTGLDPIGRKEVRDLILRLKAEGRTVFFSTHILPDVELLCDRVGIIAGGRLRDVGPLDSLLAPKVIETEVVLELPQDVQPSRFAELGRYVSGPSGSALFVTDSERTQDFLRAALQANARVLSVTPRKERLEDIFLRHVATSKEEAKEEEAKKEEAKKEEAKTQAGGAQ